MVFQSFVVSDFHIDKNADNIKKLPVANPDIPYCIIGGDICDPFSKGAIDFFEEAHNRYEKIIAIAGNHEYYNKHTMYEVKKQYKALVEGGKGGIFLDDSSTIIDGVEIVGSTLWSDIPFQYKDTVFNSKHGYTYEINQFLHKNSKSYLDEKLDTPYPEDVHSRVLLTHYPVSKRFMTKAWETSPRALKQPEGAHFRYFNDCSYMLPKVDVCIAGHTHFCAVFDAIYGKHKTVCIQNSVGHQHERSGFNNQRFISIEEGNSTVKSLSDGRWI